MSVSGTELPSTGGRGFRTAATMVPPEWTHRVSAEAASPGIGIILIDLMLVGVLLLLLRFPTFPFSVIDWDESAYILAGREVVHGHLPYVTYWEMKPLGALTLPALAMLIFGESVEVARGFSLSCVFATCCLLYLITRQFRLGRFACLGAAAFYAAFSVRLHGAAMMTEIMLAPFSAAGVLMLILG